MTDEILQKYDKLLEVLRLLACDANDQIQTFPEYANVTDEMAILFEECYRKCEFLSQNSRISSVVKLKLDDTNLLFKQMSKQYELWSIECLAQSEEWNCIRKYAKDTLDLMGENLQPPRLYWLQFINAK